MIPANATAATPVAIAAAAPIVVERLLLVNDIFDRILRLPSAAASPKEREKRGWRFRQTNRANNEEITM
jgi:hypothetical protein